MRLLGPVAVSEPRVRIVSALLGSGGEPSSEIDMWQAASDNNFSPKVVVADYREVIGPHDTHTNWQRRPNSSRHRGC